LFRDPGLDLTKKQTIVVPRCGTSEYKTKVTTESKIKNAKVDASDLYRLVRVTFNNTTDHNLIILLTEAEAFYALYIPKGDSKTVTIAKETYVVEQYGCPIFKEFHFHAQAHKNKDLVCPGTGN
jgi:hypothetical protein